MDIKDKIIDVFENRIMQLITITDITNLPQWDDTDVLGADCLLKEYRRLTNAMHSDGQSDAAEIWTNEDESAEIERQIVEDARR